MYHNFIDIPTFSLPIYLPTYLPSHLTTYLPTYSPNPSHLLNIHTFNTHMLLILAIHSLYFVFHLQFCKSLSFYSSCLFFLSYSSLPSFPTHVPSFSISSSSSSSLLLVPYLSAPFTISAPFLFFLFGKIFDSLSSSYSDPFFSSFLPFPFPYSSSISFLLLLNLFSLSLFLPALLLSMSSSSFSQLPSPSVLCFHFLLYLLLPFPFQSSQSLSPTSFTIC